jgi:hypothetical protein
LDGYDSGFGCLFECAMIPASKKPEEIMAETNQNATSVADREIEVTKMVPAKY